LTKMKKGILSKQHRDHWRQQRTFCSHRQKEKMSHSHKVQHKVQQTSEDESRGRSQEYEEQMKYKKWILIRNRNRIY
jgi:hypothetical protein